MSERKKARGALAAGALAAILASTCCLGPLVLVTLGFSGAWLGNLVVLSSYEKFTVNSVPKPCIRDRISSSSAVPFMATKRRQKYLACFQRISMRLSSGLYGGK